MTYAVPRRVIAALVVVAVVALLIGTTLDRPGRFLFDLVAIAAVVEAARSALVRPTLRVDAEGFDVAVGLHHERHAWPEVTGIGRLSRPGSGRRLRRSANALEIDLGARLVVVAGYRLGAPVDDVVTALDEFVGTSTTS